jgi:hypothetical protein
MRLMGIEPGRAEKDATPVSIAPARGGRVQIRIVAELPCEMSPLERLQAAQAYCGNFERLGLPYWAVIHAPNHHNDTRNFHLHVALSDRPSRQMVHPETGETVWDFEVQLTVRDLNKHVRVKRPCMQKKLLELSAKSWPKKERQAWCAVVNYGLARAHVGKRYDSRSYKVMGVKQVPRQRLSPAIFARERKGEVTELGVTTAREQWEAIAQSIGRQQQNFAEMDYGANLIGAKFVRRLDELKTASAAGAVKAFQRAIVLRKQIQEIRADLAAETYVAQRMFSRARLVAMEKRTSRDQALIDEAYQIGREDIPAQKQLIAAKIAELAQQEAVIRKAIARVKKELIQRNFAEAVAQHVQLQAILRRRSADEAAEAERQETTAQDAVSLAQEPSPTAPASAAAPSEGQATPSAADIERQRRHEKIWRRLLADRYNQPAPPPAPSETAHGPASSIVPVPATQAPKEPTVTSRDAGAFLPDRPTCVGSKTPTAPSAAKRTNLPPGPRVLAATGHHLPKVSSPVPPSPAVGAPPAHVPAQSQVSSAPGRAASSAQGVHVRSPEPPGPAALEKVPAATVAGNDSGARTPKSSTLGQRSPQPAKPAGVEPEITPAHTPEGAKQPAKIVSPPGGPSLEAPAAETTRSRPAGESEDVVGTTQQTEKSALGDEAALEAAQAEAAEAERRRKAELRRRVLAAQRNGRGR